MNCKNCNKNIDSHGIEYIVYEKKEDRFLLNICVPCNIDTGIFCSDACLIIYLKMTGSRNEK